MASAEARGLPGPALLRVCRHSSAFRRTSAYAASGVACLADGPAQSVAKPPGSTSVTWMPKPATSCASACEKPSSAHFEAW